MHKYAKHIIQKGRIPKHGPPPSVDLVHGPLYGPGPWTTPVERPNC